MKYLNLLSSQTNFFQPSWDIFTALFFAGTVFLFSLTAGKNKLVAGIISLYISLVLEKMIFYPYLEKYLSKIGINFSNFYILKIIVFLLIFIFLTLFFSRRIFSKKNYGDGFLLEAFILSFLQTGFLMAIFFSFLPLEILNKFSSFVYYFFISGLAKSIWTIAPVLVIILLGLGADER